MGIIYLLGLGLARWQLKVVATKLGGHRWMPPVLVDSVVGTGSIDLPAIFNINGILYLYSESI